MSQKTFSKTYLEMVETGLRH